MGRRGQEYRVLSNGEEGARVQGFEQWGGGAGVGGFEPWGGGGQSRGF